MSWLKKIWAPCLVLCAANAGAQDAPGGVVVHSDPRLSLLVKKSRDIEVAAEDAATHPAQAKHAKSMPLAMAVMPAKPTVPAGNAPVPATAPPKLMPDFPSTSQADKKANPYILATAPPPEQPDKPQQPIKINSDEASTTGYAGGWGPPPVHRKLKVIYSGKGYRVQIYNGPSREKAIEIKSAFMRAYPGMRTYLTYVSPCFRVKVGDYRTRNEAIGMLREARDSYTPCMIVPDIVTISTF